MREKVLWKQESMNRYGKKIEFPRLVAWYGDDEMPYSFSGITLQPNPWTKEILKIKNSIEPNGLFQQGAFKFQQGWSGFSFMAHGFRT